MAGYSGTPLERKLGIKPEMIVFVDKAPVGFALDATTTARLPRRIDATLTFHTRRQTLAARLPSLIERTARDGMIWICWPKQAALKADPELTSDLDGNVVRALGLDAGLVDVKVAAIDEVWSGLKFVRRVADR